MDIRNPQKKFIRQLDRVLDGQPINTAGLLREEIEILHMVQKIKKPERSYEPADIFKLNLRKKLLNFHESELSAPDFKSMPQWDSGSFALPAKPRRWVWAVAPLVALVVLATYISFAVASPGFYEKYIPEAVKKILSDTQVVQTGSLRVTSDPAGATVFLNNQEQNITPTEIGGIRVGIHEVLIKYPGYQEERREIKIKPDQVTLVEISLMSVVSEEELPAEIEQITEERFQVVTWDQFSDHSVIQLTDTEGENVATAFTIKASVKQITVDNDGIIFFSSKTAAGDYIYRLKPTGELKQIAYLKNGLADDFIVSPDGAAISYITTVAGKQEVHLIDSNATDQVIYKVPPATWRPIGFREREVVLVQTEPDRQTVRRIITVSSDNDSGREWTLPAGKNKIINIHNSAVDFRRGLFIQNNQKTILVSSETESPREIFSGSTDQAVWSGSKILVSEGSRIWLVDPDQNQAEEIYHSADNSAIKKLVCGSSGKEAVAWLSDNTLAVINISDKRVREINVHGSVKDCLAVLPPKTFTSSNQVINLPDSGEKQSLSLLNKLNLSPASDEALAVQNDYIIRVSNGESSLEVIALSDVAPPKIIGSLPRTDFSRDLMIAANERYAVVTGGRLRFINLENPQSPRVVAEEGISALGVTVSDNRAYVVAEGRLFIYSLTGEIPQKINETEIDLNQALSVAVNNNRLFIAGGEEGLMILDITDNRAPKILHRNRDNFVRFLAPAGEFCYVFIGTPGGVGQVQVWEVATPKEVKIIKPAFSSGTVYGRGCNLYGAFPRLAAWEAQPDGAIKLVSEAPNGPEATAVSPVVFLKKYLAILSENRLMIYR